MSIDYRDYPILYVDDDAPNLKTFEYTFGDDFTIVTAPSGEAALAILGTRDIAVLLTDERMPAMTGVELCERSRAKRPDTHRMIVTAYMDVRATVDAINRGQVHRYLLKPWSNHDMDQALRDGIERVAMQRAVRETQMRLFRRGQGQVLGTLLAETLHEIGKPLRAAEDYVQQADRELAALVNAMDPSTPNVDLLRRHASAASEGVRAAAGAMALASAEQRDLKRAMPGQRDDTASCDGARTVNAAILLARPHVDPVAVLDAKVRDVPELQIDAGALAEVVLNLVLNAAEAIGEADRGRGRITVSLDNAGDAALLVVQDTGPGMSREVLARIFAPRFTTKPEGQGLGLSIARGRVRAAGGDITAHSTPDRGTRFEVNLPLAKKP